MGLLSIAASRASRGDNIKLTGKGIKMCLSFDFSPFGRALGISTCEIYSDCTYNERDEKR